MELEYSKKVAQIKLATKIKRKEKNMAVKLNGRTYWYVDTVVIDEIIYDIYEDEYGNVHYQVSDTLY